MKNKPKTNSPFSDPCYMLMLPRLFHHLLSSTQAREDNVPNLVLFAWSSTWVLRKTTLSQSAPADWKRKLQVFHVFSCSWRRHSRAVEVSPGWTQAVESRHIAVWVQPYLLLHWRDEAQLERPSIPYQAVDAGGGCGHKWIHLLESGNGNCAPLARQAGAK